jgi:hypothetical protein
MAWWQFWKRDKIEKRVSASGFTAEVISMREAFVSGRRGLAELTATAQPCISLWENGLALADVTGTDLLDRRTLAMLGRSLALRGEALFLIREDGLIPCSDWDLRTNNGRPAAYRLSISEAAGGTTQTALAAEVVHVRIDADVVTPWLGQAPLKRASLTAGMLHAVESALAETFENCALGSLIVPMPEQAEQDNVALGRSFWRSHASLCFRTARCAFQDPPILRHCMDRRDVNSFCAILVAKSPGASCRGLLF